MFLSAVLREDSSIQGGHRVKHVPHRSSQDPHAHAHATRCQHSQQGCCQQLKHIPAGVARPPALLRRPQTLSCPHSCPAAAGSAQAAAAPADKDSGQAGTDSVNVTPRINLNLRAHDNMFVHPHDACQSKTHDTPDAKSCAGHACASTCCHSQAALAERQSMKHLHAPCVVLSLATHPTLAPLANAGCSTCQDPHWLGWGRRRHKPQLHKLQWLRHLQQAQQDDYSSSGAVCKQLLLVHA